MNHLMIDLETLSTETNAAIISIGAVLFDEKDLGASFYTEIGLWNYFDKFDDASAYDVSPETLSWWLGNSREERSIFRNPDADKQSIWDAVEAFRIFVLNSGCDADTLRVWGNGAAFDPPILKHALTTESCHVPWEFYNERCFRTMKNIYSFVPVPKFEGTKHNALDDAVHQARHLQAIMSHIGKELN